MRLLLKQQGWEPSQRANSLLALLYKQRRGELTQDPEHLLGTVDILVLQTYEKVHPVDFQGMQWRSSRDSPSKS